MYNATVLVVAVSTHPFDLDEPDVEDEGGVGRDDLPHPPLAVAEVRGKGDPASLPQAHADQSPVHTGYDAPVAQGHDVGGVVVKAEWERRCIYVLTRAVILVLESILIIGS